MRKNSQQTVERDRLQAAELIISDRCLVCGRDSKGKAICTDPNCAAELALG